ncbi:hypothetical protein [Streptomyces sp. NBC_01176]|uniref:hypothetical protein n=1 Tax=Streptomyces sp. NBC_01176 TaxID=2903760 RepID=UPI00386BC79D
MKWTVVRTGIAVLAVIGLASRCGGAAVAPGVRPAPGRPQALPVRVAAAWKGAGPDMIRRFLKRITGEGRAVARLEGHL